MHFQIALLFHSSQLSNRTKKNNETINSQRSKTYEEKNEKRIK